MTEPQRYSARIPAFWWEKLQRKDFTGDLAVWLHENKVKSVRPAWEGEMPDKLGTFEGELCCVVDITYTKWEAV